MRILSRVDTIQLYDIFVWFWKLVTRFDLCGIELLLCLSLPIKIGLVCDYLSCNLISIVCMIQHSAVYKFLWDLWAFAWLWVILKIITILKFKCLSLPYKINQANQVYALHDISATIKGHLSPSINPFRSHCSWPISTFYSIAMILQQIQNIHSLHFFQPKLPHWNVH